jgi:acyl carrier protein
VTEGVLGFDDFAARVAEGLRLETDELTSGARLVDDLGLDSFDLVEVLAIVQELGVHLPDEVAVGLDTVGDVYREYEARARRAVGGTAGSGHTP